MSSESDQEMTDFRGLLEALQRESVRFIIVGGVAARIHGATRLTEDLDLVYARDPENLEHLAAALAGLEPYLRGAPPGLPFRWDVRTLRMGFNFTLTTTLGDIDLLGEISGGGTHGDLLGHTVMVELYGICCRCLDLQTLIRVKRAAGRARDLEAIAELEAILEERHRSGEGSR